MARKAKKVEKKPCKQCGRAKGNAAKHIERPRALNRPIPKSFGKWTIAGLGVLEVYSDGSYVAENGLRGQLTEQQFKIIRICNE